MLAQAIVCSVLLESRRSKYDERAFKRRNGWYKMAELDDRGDPGAALLQQSFDLLEYLSAVAREIGPKPVRDVRSHPFVILPAEVPSHPAVALGTSPTRTSSIEVARVVSPPNVQIPNSLRELLHGEADLSDPSLTPRLSTQAVEQHVAMETTQLDDENPDFKADRERSAREEIQTRFSDWLDQEWTPWATEHAPTVEARKLYTRLYDLRLRAEADEATHEVVLGHLLLSYGQGSERAVAPLLTCNATVEIDSQDASVRVVPEQALQLELDSFEGLDLAGMDALVAMRGTLRDNPPDPWTPNERLKVRQRLISPLGLDAALVETQGLPTPSTVPLLNDGWVLMLRRRPLRQERFYDELAHKIRDENFLPEALASVVTDSDSVDRAILALGQDIRSDDGTADRLLMPLPTNAEQERIARQLANSRGVTVQGPPGTGKSHTIVNLISHLVAQGKRVLVTAEKEQALSVLRDKIPEELRDLSVAVLGSTPAAMEDLRGAVQSMQDSLSAISIHSEERRISELNSSIDELRDAIARTDVALVEALRTEQQEFPLPTGSARAPDVAKWLAVERHLDCIPDSIDRDAHFPLTTDEYAEFISLAKRVSADDAKACMQNTPDHSTLIGTEDLQKQYETRDRLHVRVTELEDAGLRLEAVEQLDRSHLNSLADELRSNAAWLGGNSGDWETRLARLTLENPPAATWVSEHNQRVRVDIADARLLANDIAGHHVVIPDGNPVTQLATVNEWQRRLSQGKKVSTFSSKGLKELSKLVEVDGHPVSTLRHVELVERKIRLTTAARGAHTLASQAYTPAELSVPALDDTFLFSMERLAERVDEVHRWWTTSYPNLTSRLKVLFSDNDPAATAEGLNHCASRLYDAAARLEERELQQWFTDLTTWLRDRQVSPNASPLWDDLISALRLESVSKWGEARREALRLAQTRIDALRMTELREQLAKGGAPTWARQIMENEGSADIACATEIVLNVWERAKARSWIQSLHAHANIDLLMERSHSDTVRLRSEVLEVASRSARVELKRNMKDKERRSLETWMTAVKKVGKGTGKNAPRFQAAAREALPGAMGAVPVWIMPMYRVLENFDPRVSQMFDVVIVDESSQCDLLSLGVLALGKKSVVVGDDRQTTPSRVGIRVDRIAALQDQHLKHIPEAKLLTVDESLYSISGRAFPSTIALKEHFRCVPEIIEFSNRYYNGAIQPLREVGVPEIGDPVKVVTLKDAVSVDTGKGRVNRDEAAAIADQITRCVSDSNYDDLTFGVVTMMSGPQAQVIQDEIRERIGDAEFERRRLRVGNPPLFQGDERNVIFISMVAHENSFAATKLQYMQWANVAASRAQDQLWIFHSMDPSTLHHEDQRRAMIEYGQGHGRRQASKDLYSLTDSKFERDVLKQLLDRNYDVEPQHRVGSYKIDFVVRLGPGQRLAIECDGDAFHGPDKWDEDVRRQRVLERLGWTFWRIRASLYYLDPESAMAPLWDRLEELRERTAGIAERLKIELPSDLRLSTSPDQSRLEPERATIEALATETVRRAAIEDADESTDEAAPDENNQSDSWRQNPVSELGTTTHPVDRQNTLDRAAGKQLESSLEPDTTMDPIATHVNTSQQVATESNWNEWPDIGRAWSQGTEYKLSANGDIQPRAGGTPLAAVIGASKAAQIRVTMREARKSGGRFKVDSGGTMVTMIDHEIIFVMTVTRENWFPTHWD